MSRIIFHIDVNSAYLSWTAVEQLKSGAALDIRTIPAIIGGDRKSRHGVVLAKSIPAKKYGIHTGEPVANALRKCPDIHMEPPDHALYHEYSRRLMEFLHTYTPDIEQVSVDECYLDFTGIAHRYHSYVSAAFEIKDRVREKFGFTVNIGISSNKLLAKMASDFEKPDRVHTLFPGEIREKMWPLPVERLFLVGESARRRLNDLGIFTIGDLAKADPAFIRQHLKKHGEVIYKYANGIGETKITHMEPDNKGYSNSTTLAEDVADADTAKMVLLSLCETVCARLRKDGMKSGCIAVQLTYHTFQNRTHQCTLPTLTNVTGEVASIAFQLFDQMWDGNTPIRLLGVAAQKVTGDSIRQYNLFDLDKYEKMEKLDAAIDKIRGKYGETSITRACFMKKEMPKGWRGQK